MKLYYAPNSPFARKVRIVLHERGIDHEAIAIDTNEPPPDFPRANPNLRVPCLVDGERALFESNVIVDYLLQTYPAKGKAAAQPPLAAGMTRPEHHWDDLLVLTAIETMLDSGINLFQFIRRGMKADQSTYLQREEKRIQSELDWLEARVGPQGFVPGVLSIQDLNLAIALHWLDFRKPVPWRGRPKLEALAARYEGRTSFQATKPAA